MKYMVEICLILDSIYILFIVWIFMVFITGCNPAPRLNPNGIPTTTGNGIHKFIDTETGVTCYTIYQQDGIHCFTKYELEN